jgi:hypothetical protein
MKGFVLSESTAGSVCRNVFRMSASLSKFAPGYRHFHHEPIDELSSTASRPPQVSRCGIVIEQTAERRHRERGGSSPCLRWDGESIKPSFQCLNLPVHSRYPGFAVRTFSFHETLLDKQPGFAIHSRDVHSFVSSHPSRPAPEPSHGF